MEAEKDPRVAFIRDFVDRFGGRASGSEQEKQAQQHFREKLLELSPNAQVEEFKDAIGAKFGSLKWFCLAFWLSLGLFPFFPEVAMSLAFVNAILFVWHFLLYGDVLDKIWPKKTSSNAYAVLEPQGEATSTIWFGGHMDSVREFQWWYRLKTFGMILTLLSGVVFLFWGTVAVLYAMNALNDFIRTYNSFCGTVPGADYFDYLWMAAVLLSPITLSMFFMHGKKVVDGANDNLSGVAMAFAMGQQLLDPTQKGKNILQHTRIGIMSFGCEEMGLKGAKAFVKKHQSWLRETQSVLVNIDTIKDPEFLTIVEGERNPMVRYPEKLVDRLVHSFGEEEVPVIRARMNVGATDAAAWHRKGIPAVSIIGMDSKNLDPCYHTRLDTLEHLNPEGMEKLEKVLLHFVKNWDKDTRNIDMWRFK